MKNEKRAILPGDQIKWVEGTGKFTGTVDSIAGLEIFRVKCHDLFAEELPYVHRRQIVKVFRKKKKREPRVVVETQWGCDGLNKCLHFSEDSAINFMQTERPGVQYKIVRFREVL